MTVATLPDRPVVGQVLPTWPRGRYDRVNTAQGRGWVPLEIEGATYYTTAEAAVQLGISHSAIRFAIANGTLASVDVNPRLNMVSAASLEQYRRAHLGRRGRPKGSRNRTRLPEGSGPAADAGGDDSTGAADP